MDCSALATDGGWTSGATLTALGALVAAFAAFVVGLLNYRNQARQLGVAREGQLTERFTRAVEQLGSNKPDVRVGGVYALEQIANASARDRRAIVEVLIAFVHGHAPWPPSRPEQKAEDFDLDRLPVLRAWAPDVQAAMTVLARRPFALDGEELDLTDLDLRRAELPKANLRRAKLHGARLQRAVLHDANLRGAEFYRARLERADLKDTNLQGAKLRRANLWRADLGGADLRSAGLKFSNFA
jgi:hypothetical protein